MTFANKADKQIYFRLIALWVICEAMLGGIIHGLKLPVSGLIVGSSAVICICLIGNYYPVRGAILKATIIVAIFKMMLSPQSPMPAYIAVFFQGLVAEIIFLNRKSYKLNCVLFAVLALVESGIQRLLVMTVLFGMDIWKAINIFISGITRQETITNYSYYLAAGYVVMHMIVGVAVGWYAGVLPHKQRTADGADDADNADDVVTTGKVETDYLLSFKENGRGGGAEAMLFFQRKKKSKVILFLVWIALSVIFIQAILNPENAWIPSNVILKLLLRSFLIILTWIVVINPILLKFLHRWLEKKKLKSQSDINEIARLLPVMQLLVVKSWKKSARQKGIKRISLFFRILIYNLLQHE